MGIQILELFQSFQYRILNIEQGMTNVEGKPEAGEERFQNWSRVRNKEIMKVQVNFKCS